MTAGLLGLAAAASLAVGAVLSRRFALAYPPAQLPGPLYALNAALVTLAVPFVPWASSWRIDVLLAASVAAMVVTSVAIFHLFAEGSAAAVTAGSAVSPLAAVVFSALLLSVQVRPETLAEAAIVAGGVLLSLPGAFTGLTRLRALGLLVVAAAGNGLLTVLGKGLLNSGAGVVEVYLCRTAGAALVLMIAFPPRDLPWRELPRMVIRAGAITLSYLLLLVGLAQGTPTTVQTMVATAPLMLLLGEMAIRRRLPSTRLVLASLLVLAGVALVLGGTSQ